MSEARLAKARAGYEGYVYRTTPREEWVDAIPLPSMATMPSRIHLLAADIRYAIQRFLYR